MQLLSETHRPYACEQINLWLQVLSALCWEGQESDRSSVTVQGTSVRFGNTAEEWRLWTVHCSYCGCQSGLAESLFTALHHCMECTCGLAMRILSDYLSVKRVHRDKTEERSDQIFIPYERSFSLVFWEEEWLVGWRLLPEILDQPAPIRAKLPILNRYSLVALQP